MIICMATVEAQVYYPRHIYMAIVLQALIIVQSIIHCCSKVFTTGQARVNYVIKYMGGQ